MAGENGWDQGLDPVVADQVAYIMSSFGQRGINVGVVAANGGVSYMYAEGHLLVREEHLGRVQQMLPRAASTSTSASAYAPAECVARGIMLIRMEADASGGQPAVPDLLARIDAELGAGIATPNHVLTVAPGEVHPCPATEPQQVYDGIEPSPSVDVDYAGAGVLIYVADTGLLDGAAASAPWLAGVQGDPDPLPEPEPAPSRSRRTPGTVRSWPGWPGASRPRRTFSSRTSSTSRAARWRRTSWASSTLLSTSVSTSSTCR